MVRPRIVVLENVSAVLGPEFQRVANDLAALGYDIAWTCLRASDVGAPHRRERLFIVAAADASGDGRGDGPVELLPTPAAARSGRNQSPSPGAAVRPSLDSITELLQTPSTADGDGSRKARGGDRSDEPLLPGQAVEMAQQWGKYEPAIRRWENLTRLAPAPTEPNKNGNPRLSAAFSEWLMGWPAGHVTAVPGISRNEQLRIIGNGVVPQQAQAAIRWLLSVAEVAA
jgi:DNA (cytosine-5)-methyltransferase 1